LDVVIPIQGTWAQIRGRVDALAFEQCHVPGALAWSWTTDLCDTIQRDILEIAKRSHDI
jgi:hypothetical protein